MIVISITNAIKLVQAGQVILLRQRRELEELTDRIKENLLDYASGADLTTITQWVVQEPSWDMLRVLDAALREGTMPHSPGELASAIKTSESKMVVRYILIDHLLTGSTYESSQVIACLRGMGNSAISRNWDLNVSDDLRNAAVMVKLMYGLAGSSMVASGTVGLVNKNILLCEEMCNVALENPDRVDDIVNFVRARRNDRLDPETAAVIQKNASDVNSVLQIMDRKNDTLVHLVKEMLESDHGVLVEGML